MWLFTPRERYGLVRLQVVLPRWKHSRHKVGNIPGSTRIVAFLLLLWHPKMSWLSCGSFTINTSDRKRVLCLLARSTSPREHTLQSIVHERWQKSGCGNIFINLAFFHPRLACMSDSYWMINYPSETMKISRPNLGNWNVRCIYVHKFSGPLTAPNGAETMTTKFSISL